MRVCDGYCLVQLSYGGTIAKILHLVAIPTRRELRLGWAGM